MEVQGRGRSWLFGHKGRPFSYFAYRVRAHTPKATIRNVMHDSAELHMRTEGSAELCQTRLSSSTPNHLSDP